MQGLVLLSGGLHSALALAEAVKEDPSVCWRAIHFSHGQLAVPEKAMAVEQAAKAGVPLRVERLSPGSKVRTKLTGDLMALMYMAGAIEAADKKKLEAVVVIGAAGGGEPRVLECCEWTALQLFNVKFRIGTHRFHAGSVAERVRRVGLDIRRTWSCTRPTYLEDGGWVACGRCPKCLLRSMVVGKVLGEGEGEQRWEG